VLLGERLAFLETHHALLLQVDLVPHQHHRYLIPTSQPTVVSQPATRVLKMEVSGVTRAGATYIRFVFLDAHDVRP
jgi:hypothetical protein